ncbi:MAG TPA: hypothetical protein VKK79_01520 [Candidatus Lokiarchaeia archaeon]|nr:hypothetical protein [Candidatus Lokiarchaeia archaeon]
MSKAGSEGRETGKDRMKKWGPPCAGVLGVIIGFAIFVANAMTLSASFTSNRTETFLIINFTSLALWLGSLAFLCCLSWQRARRGRMELEVPNLISPERAKRANKPIDPLEKARDAQELRQLAEEFKRGIVADDIMTPKIAALMARAEAAMDQENFLEAGRILTRIRELIVAKNRPRRFGKGVPRPTAAISSESERHTPH